MMEVVDSETRSLVFYLFCHLYDSGAPLVFELSKSLTGSFDFFIGLSDAQLSQLDETSKMMPVM